MDDLKKTKKVLIEELQVLRSRLAELERIAAEHKRVEQALRESEQLYARAEQIGRFGHWERDIAEDRAAWSDECYRICGVDPDEFQPTYDNYLNLLHPSDRDLFQSAFEAAVSQGKPFDIEYRVVRPDETTRVVHSVAEVRLDNAGRPLKLLGTAHDITERKQAEQALRKAHHQLEARVKERTAALSESNELLRKEIAERKRTEQDLIQSEEKYRSVIENIGIGVSLISPEMEILSLNKQIRQWFPDVDVSKKPLCYKSFNRPPREHICSYCPTYKSLKDGQVHEAITQTPAGDKIVNYRIISSPIKDRDGKVVAAIEMVEDITEQKRAENALRESEERYKVLFQGAAEGIIVADVETMMFEYVNPAICRMLGYAEEKLTQMGVCDIHPKEDLEHVIADFQAQARGEITLSSGIPCLRKDGKIIYADINTANVLINGRRCNVGFFTDVTERKKAEEELYKAEVKYRTLVEQIPAVTYVAALDRASTTLYVSPQIETLIGFSQAEYEKDPDIWRKRLHPDDCERVMAEVERTHTAGEPFSSEYRMIARDGRLVWLHDEAVLVRDSQNRPLLLQGVMFDITERRQAEQALRKTRNELEIRVQQRTADLAKAIEELRSEIAERKKAEKKLLTYQRQLRSLASELPLAEERLRRRIATNVHDHVGQNLAISKIKLESLRDSVSSPEIASSLREIGDMISQTIESTRTLTFELSPPVLYELGFEAAVEWLVRQTRQRHILSTEFNSDGQTKPLSHNVRVLLFQAVRELLVNVAKHAHARNVTVSTRRVGDEIHVSVEDDGVGFDTSKVSPHGMGGFGLFSIRERMGGIGGRVDIESEPDRGTRVTLTAPIDHADQNDREKDG
jgi:PAS domain S-box-containing protein